MTPGLTPAPEPSRPAPVASWRHTLVLTIVFLGIAAAGARLQGRPASGPGPAGEHRGAILYVSLIVAEWAVVYYVWNGGLRERRVWADIFEGWRSSFS